MGWTSEPAPAAEVESGIAPPPDRKARNPRKAKAAPKAAEKMLEAIAFVEGATDDTQEFMAHVRVAGGWMVAFDGSIAAGHPIEEDLEVCPHLKRLKEAVGRAGATLALSVGEAGRLSVAGAKARFTVPCLPGSALFSVMPDVSIATLTDDLKAGFAATVALAKEEADTIHEQSLLLRANTVVGCNGQLALEYWHGIDLPPGLGIPHKAAKIVAKQSQKLVGFGWDAGRSVTFHFENGAWIKTQLMAGQWPDIDTVLNSQCYLADAPEELFEALDAILSFSDDGAVHFHDDKLKTTYSNTEGGGLAGAAYDVPGLQKGHSFTGRLLKLAKPAAKQIDYTTHKDRMLMLNPDDRIRGVLMKRIA
jgi:hypothetical protein